MKRYILTFLLIAISLPVVAQSQQVTGGFVRKKTTETVTIEEKVKKTYEKFDAKLGLTHIAEFNVKGYVAPNQRPHISLSYIAGWRFNNWFLAGIGTGLDFATEVAPDFKKHEIGELIVPLDSDSDIDIYGDASSVYIPLYAHARFYFMRTRWCPYSSISFGARLAHKDCSGYLDFAAGVNYLPPSSFSEKYKIGGFYVSFGFCIAEQHEIYSTTIVLGNNKECTEPRCSLYGKGNHSHYQINDCIKLASIGPSFHIGVTF